MISMEGALLRLAFACPCGRFQWWYLWILVGCLTQFPVEGACSWWNMVRESLLRRPRRSGSATPTRGSATADSFPGGGDPADEHAEDAAAVGRAQCSLMSLREQFIGARDWEPQMKPLAVTKDGLVVVGMHLREAARDFERDANEETHAQESSALLHGIVPHGHMVLLESAATRATSWYEFHRGSTVWTVTDYSGQRYAPQLWPLDKDRERRRQRAFGAARWIRELMRAKDAFGISSWMDLETRFNVLAPHDMLVSPGPHAEIHFPGGAAINAVLLWRNTVTTLVQLSRTIERLSRRGPQRTRQAWVSRCNLTLQLIRLLGQIAMLGVTVWRLDPYHFVLDERGSLFLMPRGSFKRAEVGGAAACSDAGSGGWQDHDRRTNARDMSRVLLFVWCPDEAKEVSIYNSAPRLEDVIGVLERCTSAPEWIRRIVRAPFETEVDAAYVLLSEFYHDVYFRLRQDLEGPISDS